MIKKIVKIILVVLVLLVGLAFAAPFLFKGKIISVVKESINKNLDAKVDFHDVDISFFRHFPKVAVGIEGIQIIGNGVFAEDTLLSADRLDAALNLMSLIKGKDMTVYSVFVESPRVHAIISKDGLVNWDIIKPDSADTKTSEKEKPFNLKLQKYEISNGYILYKDEQDNMSSEIVNLNHTGSGDFTSDLFSLKTSTQADAVTFVYGNIPYLSKVKTTIDADIEIDNNQNSYSYATDNIFLNDLKISSKGVIKDLSEKGYDMDISFKAPSSDFKSILSLIPSIYKNDFSKIKTTGTAVFAGTIKGIYNDTCIPAYHIDLNVKDGFFQYPDLPKPVKNINISANIDNTDGQTDQSTVNVEKAHIEFDNEPFDFRVLVKNPVTDMFVDAAAKGKLDLGKVSQFIKLESGTKLSGLINADVTVKGNVSAIEKQQYDKFSAGGTVIVNDLFYVSKDYPTGVKINSLASTFTPQKVAINNVSGQYLSSNFTGSGQINNLLNYVLKNKPLNANLAVNADNVNLNDWMGTSADTTTTGEAASPVAVPSNLDITIAAKIDKLHYDKIDIQNLSGTLQVFDETLRMLNVKGNALDGSMIINGLYSTKMSKTKPDISLTYDVQSVDVQKTFYAFNTVQKLMPIGKFIAGKLTSQMTLNGKLGDNMMPEMSSLSGNGNMFLLEGFLSKFAPLDKIASSLSVKQLEQISLEDIKNSFEFSNGKLLIKPFKVKVKDIEMEIGGLQGFDQSLDFLVNMKLPRAMMGEKGNQLVNNLASQISSKGVPVQLGETINLNLKLGGFMKTPTVKTDLKQGVESMADQLKQQVTSFVQAKIDSTKQVITSAVKDTATAIKNQMINSAKDELTKKLFGDKTATPDTAQAKPKTKPEESIKGLMNNLFKKKAKDTATKH